MKASAATPVAQDVAKSLRKLARPERAKVSSRFFKTGKGEYGEGDVFIGVSVPDSRRIVRQFTSLPLKEVEKLLKSKIHEERLVGVLIMVSKYRAKKADQSERRQVFRCYIKNLRCINNWDLVDTSAEHIVGAHLKSADRGLLRKLARSKNLWYRRVAIMSTFHFIRHGDFTETLKLAESLLRDEHDLIHKAVGWMLREVGKRDQDREADFLDRWATEMSRTMLRYAIEKFPPEQRRHYLSMPYRTAPRQLRYDNKSPKAPKTARAAAIKKVV
jgi:3-methyladenine DNA glycosylase AlkD